MNIQCISRESCEQKNSDYWKDLKFVPSNGSCRLVKYCDSIEINEQTDISKRNNAEECRVVTGSVTIRFAKNFCYISSRAFRILRGIEEIYGYLNVTDFPPETKMVEILPKLKIVQGVNLELGVNSLVFDSNTGLGSHRVTSPNNTISHEYNENIKLEITPKTYGFAVKILNEEFNW